jgi:hypothetical protein
MEWWREALMTLGTKDDALFNKFIDQNDLHLVRIFSWNVSYITTVPFSEL